MNKAIIVSTWRYMLHSPLRLLMFGLFMLATYFILRSVADSGLAGLGSVWAYASIFGNLLAWTLGAGLIRNDRNSGVLALVLLRPLSRAEYVVSKWLALTAACWAVSALVALLALAFLPSAMLVEAWQAFAALLLLTASASAILTLISALPMGFGDLGLLAIFLLADWIILIYGSMHGLAWMDSVASFVFRVLLPHYPRPAMAGALPELGADIALQLGAGFAGILGAVWFTQRLELNYGEAN